VIPPAFGEKNQVNFGPVNTKIQKSNCTDPKRFFRKTIFWPLRGVVSPNFYVC